MDLTSPPTIEGLSAEEVRRISDKHGVSPWALVHFSDAERRHMLDRVDEELPRRYAAGPGMARSLADASEQRRVQAEEEQRIVAEALAMLAEQQAESEPTSLARLVPFPRLDGIEVVYLGRNGGRVVVQSSQEPSPRSGEGDPYRPPSS